MDIRSAHADDAAAITALIDLVAQQDATLGLDRYPGGASGLRQQIEGTHSGVSAFLVATDAGDLAGYAFIGRYTTPSLAHVGVLSIVVHPAHRRAGVGRALMEEGAEWARSVGVRKLTLSVLATNFPGRALFLSCGFVDEALRKEQLRVGSEFIDEVLMARWLA
ncbi:MAG: GNAT family N-acetyltransferase [Thermaerobacter sp.]|nr:GNAT family N-acetyltransferase [Thermaerobacter sp.]